VLTAPWGRVEVGMKKKTPPKFSLLSYKVDYRKDGIIAETYLLEELPVYNTGRCDE